MHGALFYFPYFYKMKIPLDICALINNPHILPCALHKPKKNQLIKGNTHFNFLNKLSNTTHTIYKPYILVASLFL